MDFACEQCVQNVCKYALAVAVCITISDGVAQAQGLMEYGGLMAMPKAVPTQGLSGALGRAFGAIPNALPGQNTAPAQAAPAIPASVATVRPDGTVAVDPKKLAAVTAKANADQAAAKQILARTNATPAELKEAEKRLRDAVTVRNSIWGYRDANIPKLLDQLGLTYERMKQPALARQCYQNAINLINKNYGFGSNERLDTFVLMAPLLVKEGDLSEALNLQQQIALIKERKAGATSIDTIEARITWAGTARALDKPNAAALYKQCLTDIDRAGTNLSAEQASKLKGEIIPGYVEVLKKQGREEEAKQAAELLGDNAAAAAAAPPAGSSAAAAAASAPAPATSSEPGAAAATQAAGAPAAAPESGTASATTGQAAAPTGAPSAVPAK